MNPINTDIELRKDLCRDYKIINDNIHGTISLSRFAMYIINTPEFQRLRYLKQLGTCNYVFPNAVHTRFEHSIGTYHLSKKIIKTIIHKSKKEDIDSVMKLIPELQEYYSNNNITENYLDEFISELIAIGGLCHDIGHGPFSHIFDDFFLHQFKKSNDENLYHEFRSCQILKSIIKKNDILNTIINDALIQFMSNIINPDCKKHLDFVYQIVSNSLNSIDVDKFDYITRDSKMLGINTAFSFDKLITNAMVINNIICYPRKIDLDIVNLFTSRYYLHRKVYVHKSVVSIQLLILELMKLLESKLNIFDSIYNIDNFILLTDEYILNLGRFYSKENDNIKKIISIIDSREIYPLVFSKVYKPYDIELNEINIKTIYNNKNINHLCSTDDLILSTHKIGFVSGNKPNPLNSVYLYHSKDPYSNLTVLTNLETIKLIPEIYQEIIIMIFYKNKKDVDTINKLRQIFIY